MLEITMLIGLAIVFILFAIAIKILSDGDNSPEDNNAVGFIGNGSGKLQSREDHTPENTGTNGYYR